MYLKFINGVACRAEQDRGMFRLWIGGRKVLNYFQTVDQAFDYAKKRIGTLQNVN